MARAIPIEATRTDVAMLRDFHALPENERVEFARSIAAAARYWCKPAAHVGKEERARYKRFMKGALTAPR
jgi:hypothetical protein